MKSKVSYNLLFSSVLSCTFFIAHAQNFDPDYVEYHAKVLPGTPNAANFTIYGDIPVNHATGIPQISIPLFTIEEDGVSVPISLSYHASGIKVDDLASVVGLKWTLNAGGGIFRQVNDKMDEDGWLHPSKRGVVNPTWLSQQTHPLNHSLTQTLIGSSASTDDYFPDDFSYNFTGHSGSFVFDLTGNSKHEQQQNVKISQVPLGQGNLIDFVADDGLGNTYQFNSNEYNSQSVFSIFTNNNNWSGDRVNQTTGWMLDQITTRNNRIVSFTYEDYSLTYTLTNVSNAIYDAPGCGTISNTHTCGCIASSNTTDVNDLLRTSVVYTPQNKLVKTIESTDVRATFHYSNDPSLSDWKRRLDSITILDKIGNKTKSYQFTYGKYGGDSRLRLDELQEIGYDGIARPPYSFEYTSGHLPNKGDMGKDFHGYYNGKPNQSLVPFSLTAYNSIGPVHRNYLADRSEDSVKLQYGVLKKIKYPTGGSTNFSYEANTAPAISPINPTYSSKTAGVSTQIYGTTETSGANTLFRSPFTVGANPVTSVSYNGSSDVCSYDPNNPNIDCSKFNIYPATGPIITGPPVFNPDQVVLADGSVNLAAGDYVLELIVETSNLNANPNALIEMGLAWQEEDPLSEQTIYAGGLRVKAIENKDENGSLQEKTNFTYQGLNGYSLDVSNHFRNYGSRAIFSSNNNALNPALIKTGHFCDTVTIEKISLSEVLKTVEVFEPILRNKSYESKLKRQELYEGARIVKRTDLENTETLLTTENYWILGEQDLCYSPNGAGPEALGFNNPDSFNYYYRKNVVTKRKVTDFLYAQGEPFSCAVTIHNYQYNNNLLPIREELDGRYYVTNVNDLDTNNYSVATDGELKVVEYTYPEDHSSEEPILASMANGAAYALAVSKKVYDHTDLVLGQFMEYDTQGNVVATYRYDKGQGSNTSSSGHIPSNYGLFQEYTIQNGRPVEIKRSDGPTTTLVWNSTGNYLMASIENATLGQVNNLSGFPGTYSVTSGLTSTQENALRGLANVLVTTYAYEPLLGVKTVKDPRGYMMHYEYDGLGRLKVVKDDNDDYISEYFYHYKGH